MAYKDKEKQHAYFKAWYKNNKEYAHQLHSNYYYAIGRDKKHRAYVLRKEFQRLCQIFNSA